ncbi:prepilin-type N-terminal cleavage/methylation domain-containing protein [Aquincola sp. S2]|uniref:Prepilin-type N-terminal cleavage/methylation domain-containing protein n=1 Tax=Pseudaquabacterium terrae TaxID=2732868 RepID=A0ABX2ENR4_9BURK|nr:type IV pilin protein [Aquabacterium terrae]NRF70207.1 prepilin-type N-terminal cleavage/methylation domain-containing protein [Aquabacterium terrae]
MRTTRRTRGLTLIETMAAVAITGVLATIAVPSYRSAQLRSHRADATYSLQQLQQAQDAHRERHGGYAERLDQLPGWSAGQSRHGHYRIQLQGSPDGLAYTATALAQGAQAADTECTTVTLRVEWAMSFQGPQPGCWHS